MINKLEPLNEVDVVVIGAGFAGLVAAKTYLQCAPETELVILDANPSIGGTWSKERIYSTVKTNNLYGTFEFPDFPFHTGRGAKPGEHISGDAVHTYLSNFCDAFDLTARLRLNSQAGTVQKLDDGRWLIEVQTTDPANQTPSSYVLHCTKLIVATGLTSQPESIYINGQEQFGAPIINVAQLAKEGAQIAETTPNEKKEITVIGGSKSAYDSVYYFALNGFKVNWVIRTSGAGPTWMVPARMQLGPKTLKTEHVIATRFFTWFTPCLMNRQGSLASRFLHGTKIGQTLVKAFFNGFGSDVIAQSGLNSHPELQKLIPDEKVFWYATQIAVLNYDKNIHDFIREGQVKIYRQDIARLSLNRIDLADGTQLSSPAGLVTATSWKYAPSIDIQPASIKADLGLPGAECEPAQKSQWNKLYQQADEDILDKFPVLAAGPDRKPAFTKTQENVKTESDIKGHQGAYFLYRFLAPPQLTLDHDRSIAFQGYAATFVNHTRNEISALWIYAYLNNKLHCLDNPKGEHYLPSDPSELVSQKIMYDTALQSRYWKLRYPWGYGDRFPDIGFEHIAYNDLLLSDLGLSWRRKKGWFAWVKEVFQPYSVADYRGLTVEWLAQNR